MIDGECHITQNFDGRGLGQVWCKVFDKLGPNWLRPSCRRATVFLIAPTMFKIVVELPTSSTALIILAHVILYFSNVAPNPIILLGRRIPLCAVGSNQKH